MKKKFASLVNILLSSSPLCFALLFSVQNTAIIRWDANTEPDLAGYKLYYGANSKNYTTTVDVGLETSYTLKNLKEGNNYYFSLTAYDSTGNESFFSEEVSIYLEKDDEQDFTSSPALISKYYNFPNPFNPQKEITHIRYELAETMPITIKIFDSYGKIVRTIVNNRDKSIGEHIEDVWDGKDSEDQIVQNGVYYCTISTVSGKKFIKIAVLK